MLKIPDILRLFAVYVGKVRTVSVAASSVASERALTSLSGGPLPAVQTPAGERVHGAFYAVEVDIDLGQAVPTRTMTGMARISATAHNPVAGRVKAALAPLNAFLRF